MQRLEAGFTLSDRYVLRKRVGAGGMGEVWAANDTLLARVVALKIMHPRNEDEQIYAKRFREEAMHTAGLSHLNIATLFDYGEHDNLAYLVMELVRGITLQQLLERDGAQPPSRVRSVIGQSALALAAAHEAGIVHRDVKPANIMVTKDGTVKLTDFGIARSEDSSGLTKHGEMLGTPHYVSPEQALGEVATPASDLYALGIVAHELLSGRRPFDRGTPVATALAQVQEPPPPLPDGVPDDLADVIERCLSKDPADRPAGALQVAAALGMAEIETGLDDGDDSNGTPRPRHAIGLDDTASIAKVQGSDPMHFPADWEDPNPTPLPVPPEKALDDLADGKAPSTQEIDAGAFPGAAEVRERLAAGASHTDDTVSTLIPSVTQALDRVATEDSLRIMADPWPEAATPPPRAAVRVEDTPPVPTPSAKAPTDFVALEPTSARRVPVAWVVVIVVVAVVITILLDRLL